MWKSNIVKVISKIEPYQSTPTFEMAALCIKVHKTQRNIDGLAQDCSNFIANALELVQSCTKPSIWLII